MEALSVTRLSRCGSFECERTIDTRRGQDTCFKSSQQLMTPRYTQQLMKTQAAVVSAGITPTFESSNRSSKSYRSSLYTARRTQCATQFQNNSILVGGSSNSTFSLEAPQRSTMGQLREYQSHKGQIEEYQGIKRNLRGSTTGLVRAVASTSIAAETSLSDDVARAKARLLQVLTNVQRGAATDDDQRAAIEEAQVNLEALGGGGSSLMEDGALNTLHGLWQLKYSSASDVLSILRLPSLSPLPFPLLQVGNIYQNFICKGVQDTGVIQNIVDWSIPGLLQEDKGARFCVTADFSVISDSSISLVFREAAVDSVQLSDLFRAVLAPAVLPRTQMSMEALQFFQGFNVSVPLQADASSNTGRRAAGGRYILTYLDDDTLIGRATAPSGSFIFQRAK